MILVKLNCWRTTRTTGSSTSCVMFVRHVSLLYFFHCKSNNRRAARSLSSWSSGPSNRPCQPSHSFLPQQRGDSRLCELMLNLGVNLQLEETFRSCNNRIIKARRMHTPGPCCSMFHQCNFVPTNTFLPNYLIRFWITFIWLVASIIIPLNDFSSAMYD